MSIRRVLSLILLQTACLVAGVLGGGSPFYDIQVIARPGAALGDGNTIATNHGEWYENLGDRGQPCQLLTVDAYLTEFAIPEFVSINDAGQVAFNALVNRPMPEGWAQRPSAMVVSWSPVNGQLSSVECGIIRNGSVTVLSDGTVFPRLGGLVRLTDTSGYFVQSWSSQADDGTVAFAGNYSEFHTAPDPEPHFVIDRYDTDIFLIRGTPGSWTQLGPLPSQCEGVVGACFGGRIEIANDHSVLVNEGDEHSASQGLEGPYVRYDGAGTRRVLYSVGTGGWQRFSRKPGLSRDGKAIAFVGQRADGGAGVFLHILDPSVPELANSNCIVSCGLPLALDEDGNPITFSELDLYTSPCVIHHDVGGDGNIVGDSFIVVFKGTPSRGSRANPVDPTKPLLFSGEEGLWTARVDVERELQAPTVVVLNTRGVLPVAQIGDVIGGETITYLQVWRGLGRGTAGLTGSPRQTIDSRPSPGDHYLGFWADTANGPMVLRAAHLDTDNDGLLDHWEREGGGIDIDRDGTIDLALSDFGANVRHKDIFLEIDWTAPRTNGYPGGWRNEPYPGALRSLTNAFARAPVHNPDGADGITLHVDAGAEFDRRGHPFSQNLSGTSLALLQGGDRVRMADGQHPDVIYFGAPHDPGVPTLRSRSLHEVKDLYFGTTDKRARELAFHYCVMGDWSDARGYAQSGPLQTTLNMIGVFGNGFTLPNSSTGTNAPTFVKAEAGDWVMVVSGTGAGQIRQVRGVFTEEDGATSFLIENPRFDPVPEDGAQFVILPRSTGESEIGVRGPATGDDLANQHTLPGNDIILSVATRGRGSWGIIGDRESHWRTLMHEMGHNLGLRHGGNDADCEYRGDVYWSLMSYSHQLRTSVEALGVGGETCQGYPDGDPSTPGMQVFRIDPPPPGIAPTSPIPGVVMSYSDGTDPLGFNEWAYIRMDLWRTLPFVGNSLRFLNGALPDIHQTSPSPEDASPPRTETPTIQITMPAPSESVPIGAMLNVTAMVHHDVPLDTVIATFDVNGDTNISAAEIRVASQTGAAGGASEYQVSFPAVTGLAGTRVLRVQAHDIEGNGSIAEANIAVGATSPDDLYAPYGSFTEPQYNGRVSLDRPLFVEVAAADDETRVESVWIRFDRNGDGAAEFTLAEPVDEYHYQAMIPNVTGSVGTRTLSLIVFDIWRNAMTNSMPVNVRPLDVTRPQIQITAPLDGTAAPLESIVRVRGVVTDNSPVSYVNVIFDLDGNGTSEIVYAPVSNGTNFTAVLGDFAMRVRGPLGPRSIRVEALDEANNRGFTSIAVEVVDGSGPSIELLSPLNEAVVALGVPFIVAANVADDQAVNGVLVAADIDGNGAIEEGPETRAASRISGARYEASFGPLAGPEGARQLTITAWDPAGKTSVVSSVFYAVRGAVIKSPLAGEIVKPSSTFHVRLGAATGLNMTNVTVAFDVNGDGALNGPGESVAAMPGAGAGSYMAAFANIQGSPGPRELQVTALDDGGGSNFITRTLTVGDFGGFAGAQSVKLGAVPFLPELLSENALGGSGPDQFVGTANYLFFTAIDRQAGRELFRTDGTSAGTLLLKDLNPDWTSDTGTLGGAPLPFGGITEMVVLNNALYFAAQDWHGSSFGAQYPHTGDELWTSDGTPEGTMLLKDISPGSASSSPRGLTVFNGRLYFAATGSGGNKLWSSDGTAVGTTVFATNAANPRQLTVAGSMLYFAANGKELWKSDGTPSGTVRVKDVQPEQPFPYDAIDGLNACGALVYFVANDGTNGWELWRSDGSEAGTFMLRDILPGLSAYPPTDLTCVGSLLFFVATNAAYGKELWKSDGTSAGTALVRDIVPGEFNSFPQTLVAFNGMLFFSANDGLNGQELWRSDGTSVGTMMVANIATPTTDGFSAYPSRSSSPRNLTVFNGALYFSADDGIGTRGRELWKTDGTAAGTVLVKDLAPTDGASSSPEQFYAWNGLLYFRASDGYQSELWRSDGTGTGTYRLRNLSLPDGARLTQAGAELMFSAADGLHGIELWKQNAAGLAMKADIVGGGRSSSPTNLVLFNGQWLFGGIDGADTNRVALYVTDGTSAGSRLLRSFNSFGTTTFPITPLGMVALFVASDGTNGRELWKTDGTAGGTVLLKDIWPGFGESNPRNAIAWNGAVYFGAADSINGTELWRSDGTESGTLMLSNLNSGVASSNPGWFYPFAGKLFFIATGTGTGEEIWSTDGTAAGTLLLSNIASGSAGSIPPNRPLVYFTPFLGELYFKANDGFAGAELWKTDGTGFGTRLVKEIYPGFQEGSPEYITAVGSRLFFAANSSVSVEPWISDGTTAGTTLLKNIRPRKPGGFDLASEPANFIDVGGLAFFTAFHENYGRELWRSDGTLLGTVLVRDIFPGQRSSQISDFTAIGQQLFFTARDPEHGRELWTSDGTYEGTHPVEDLVPGPGSSMPSAITNFGGQLYYFAADGGDDLSLRRLTPGGTPFTLWLDSVATLSGADRLPGADPDHDGLANIVEYEFNTNPAEPNPGPRLLSPPRVTTEGLVRNIDVIYLRRKNAAGRGLVYFIQRASELGGFISGSATFPETVTSLDAQFDAVSVRIQRPASEPINFFRLAVTSSP